MHLTIDFETRSRINLKKCGMWKYAGDKSTEVLCLAIKVDDELPVLWVPDTWFNVLMPEDHGLPLISDDRLKVFINRATTIEAHNSGFERAIWHHIMHKRHCFADVPVEKWRCSAARAAMCALPRALGQACEVMGVEMQKDEEGKKAMLKMCKPQAKRRKVDGAWVKEEHWVEDVETFITVCRYCLQDTEAEHALSAALPRMPDYELEVWRADQEINARGIQVDVEAVEVMLAMLAEAEKLLMAEFKRLPGINFSPRQDVKLIEWLGERGHHTGSVDKSHVLKLLKQHTTYEVRRALEIRQQISKSSTAKFKKLLDVVEPDGRIRGLLMYHGAATGRWSGKHFQPQNLPSRGLVLKHDQVDAAIEAARSGGAALVSALYGEPFEVAAACIRGMLVASDSKRMLCADYSAIEGRVLAWMAGESEVLEAYKSGLRMYAVAAAGVSGEPYEVIYEGKKNEDPKYVALDMVGKTIELACGYQGGVGAYRGMEESLGTSTGMTDDEIKKAIDDWRESRVLTKQLWYDMERAACEAVENPGKPVGCECVTFKVWSKWLLMRLPSGRCLYYFKPHFAEKGMPWEDDSGKPAIKECLAYYGVDSYTNRWTRLFTYGGKLVENAVQAMSRDIMAKAIVDAEKAGYDPVLSVHDELLTDTPNNTRSIDDLSTLMCRLPAWARGLPVKAEGWEGTRYRK